MNVTTYGSATVEWTSEEDPAFRQVEKIRELKRRISENSESVISCTFSTRYEGRYYDYILSLKYVDGVWRGNYVMHPGNHESSLSNILVSERDSNLEVIADWREDGLYRMKILAKVAKSEDLVDEELTRGV